jgi:hypothetical protein
MGERLLLAKDLDQSNYLANQKQGSVNKYDLTPSTAPSVPGRWALLQGHRSLEGGLYFKVTGVWKLCFTSRSQECGSWALLQGHRSLEAVLYFKVTGVFQWIRWM